MALSAFHQRSSGLNSFFVFFAGTNTYYASHIEYKNLAVTDFSGLGGFHDRFHAGIDNIVRHHDLNLHLWQKIDHVFRAAIEFGMAFLTTKTFYLGHGHTGDPYFGKRFAHVIQLERFDNCINLFHDRPLLFPHQPEDKCILVDGQRTARLFSGWITYHIPTLKRHKKTTL